MATRKRVRLTDAGIARLRPQQREHTVWDSRVAGLGVRVRSNGGKSYVLIRTVEGRTRRTSLGPVASKGTNEIRQECLAMKAEAAVAGPEEPTRKAPLFRDFVVGEWHEAHFVRCKPSSRKRMRSAPVVLISVRQKTPFFGGGGRRFSTNRDAAMRQSASHRGVSASRAAGFPPAGPNFAAVAAISP